MGDLLIVQLAQQLDGRRGDLPADLLQALAQLGKGLLQEAFVHGLIAEVGAQRVEPLDVARQLGAAVPVEVALEALGQQAALRAIEVEVTVQRPGHQEVEVAIGQLDPVAAGQYRYQQRRQQPRPAPGTERSHANCPPYDSSRA